MAIDILENTIDAAGFRRIAVQVDDLPVLYFKFPPELTVDEMKLQVREAVNLAKEVEDNITAELNRKKQITNACEAYLRGTLTNNQKADLLDALVREWKG